MTNTNKSQPICMVDHGGLPCPGFHSEFGKSQPDASDSGLKPCPFCGNAPINDSFQFHKEGPITAALKCATHTFIKMQTELWNDAWAHKRISELEASIHLHYSEESVKQQRQIDKQNNQIIDLLTGNMEQKVQIDAMANWKQKAIIALKHHLYYCAHTSDCEFIHK